MRLGEMNVLLTRTIQVIKSREKPKKTNQKLFKDDVSRGRWVLNLQHEPAVEEEVLTPPPQ